MLGGGTTSVDSDPLTWRAGRYPILISGAAKVSWP